MGQHDVGSDFRLVIVNSFRQRVAEAHPIEDCGCDIEARALLSDHPDRQMEFIGQVVTQNYEILLHLRVGGQDEPRVSNVTDGIVNQVCAQRV